MEPVSFQPDILRDQGDRQVENSFLSSGKSFYDKTPFPRLLDSLIQNGSFKKTSTIKRKINLFILATKWLENMEKK